MTETKKELFKAIFIIIAAIGVFVIFVFTIANYAQKKTCRYTIEYSLVFYINHNLIKLETPVTKNWQKLNSDEQDRLKEYVKEREDDYTECGRHSYLIQGKEYDGSYLYFSVRKNEYDQIEVKLEH